MLKAFPLRIAKDTLWNRNNEKLNNEITSDIQHHKTALWKSHLDGNWDHRENTHTLWKTLKNLSNKKMYANKNHTISFYNKPSVTSTQIANSFNKQFTNTVPHTSNKTNRKIDKQVHKLPKTTFMLTTSEISAAIRNSKNNNSTGPEGISIRHLKHIGPLGLTYLTNTFNLALNTNTIPHMWKLANIIPILKPDIDHNTGTSFRPISLLSVISKTLEKALLPYITNNIPQHHTQHGFKAKHSTTTALHNINNTIASGFNQRIQPARTIAVALDMSKAFDTVNIHTLTKKLLDTQIPPILIKFIANYIKGRKAFTTYNNKTSTQRQFKTGVPQLGVLSPTLFNIYIYSAIRTDRANGKGGGLLTYIKHNITFPDTKIPNFINPINTELQIIQLHITRTKIYTIANIYIPPRNTTSQDHATCDADITSCIQYITNLPNSIISCGHKCSFTHLALTYH